MTHSFSRRGMLGALAAGVFAAPFTSGCERGVDPRRLRLGYFPNLTHAAALTGVASGRFARAIPGVALETRAFNAGPAAVEALLAGAVDVIYVGPSPVLAVHQRTRGAWLKVLCGAASGGALLVARPGAGVRGASDLRGKRVGSPQLGNTQDVALRTYLRANGLASDDRGGDVRVLPMANADLFAQMRLGQLDAAWVPEPWGARMMLEASAELVLDERTLWPDGRFPTTLVAAREEYLQRAPQNVRALLRAHVEEVGWLRRETDAGQAMVNQGIRALGSRPIPARVLRQAWGRVDFTTDPIVDGLRTNARNAHALGFLPSEFADGLIADGWREQAEA